MNFAVNHMEEDEDEEPPIPSSQSIPLANKIKKSMNMEHIVICTHIPGQTYFETQRVLMPYDILVSINDTKILNVQHMNEVIADLAKNIEGKPYAKFELERCRMFVDLKQVLLQETAMVSKFDEPVFMTNVTVKRRRKKRRLTNISL